MYRYRMNVDPAIFCHVADIGERNPNLLHEVRDEQPGFIHAHFFEACASPEDKHRACDPYREELPFYPLRRRRSGVIMHRGEE